MERAVAARDVGVEDEAGVDAVFGVDGAAGLGAAAGAEILAVRGRGRSVVPDRGHRMPVVGVDDGGAGGDVVVVADVPLRDVDQVMVAETARGIGHARQAEIGAVGENRREQGRLVGCRVAGAQVREVVGEAGPGIDIGQNLGDAHPRQHAVQPVRQAARGLRDDRLGCGRCRACPPRSRHRRVRRARRGRRRSVRRSCSSAARPAT